MEEEIPPEFQSVEAFGEYLLDEGRTAFTFEEAEALAKARGQSVASYVIQDLKAYGFVMKERCEPKKVRGFRSNSHDRWFGPGSSPTSGGSGWEQINGFAGQKG